MTSRSVSGGASARQDLFAPAAPGSVHTGRSFHQRDRYQQQQHHYEVETSRTRHSHYSQQQQRPQQRRGAQEEEEEEERKSVRHSEHRSVSERSHRMAELEPQPPGVPSHVHESPLQLEHVIGFMGRHKRALVALPTDNAKFIKR